MSDNVKILQLVHSYKLTKIKWTVFNFQKIKPKIQMQLIWFMTDNLNEIHKERNWFSSNHFGYEPIDKTHR